MTEGWRELTVCRACGADQLWQFLSLGRTPLANAFVGPLDLERSEPTYPLDVLRCESCGLAQLGAVVESERLFATYAYATSASAPMVRHFEEYAAQAVSQFGLRGRLVVEIGSNDGALLRPMLANGARAVGVEPAENLAAAANDSGLETFHGFLGPAVASEIIDAHGRAGAVVANNVLAHIDDLRAAMRTVDALLDTDGVLIAEFPYLADLIADVEYDTIYHEHLSYLALEPMARVLEQAGLELFDVQRQAVHGGSIRIFAGRKERRQPTGRLRELQSLERSTLGTRSAFADFALRVAASREALRRLLDENLERGKRVAGLGATAKSTTLLNYCDVGTERIAWIADSTPAKQGLLTPGKRIPIVPEARLTEERPDLVVLLAWNYADAILRRSADLLAAGVRFVHPIPEARLIP